MNNRIGFGVFLIFLGVVWFLSQLNYVSINFFGAFWDLWPLLFVVIGLSIIFKKSALARLIIWLVFFSAIVLYGIYIENNEDPFGRDEKVEYRVDELDLEDVDSSRLQMNLAFGTIDIGSASGDDLEMTYPKEITEVSMGSGSDRKIELSSEDVHNFRFFGKNKTRFVYDLSLPKDVLWSIDVNTAFIDGRFKLEDLMVEEVTLDLAAGDLDLYLGDEQKKTRVEINGAATDITLYVPKDAGVRVDFNGAIKDISFRQISYEKRDNAYYSTNYDEAEQKVIIEVNTAVGDVTIVGQ